jgi:hypothetical protein
MGDLFVETQTRARELVNSTNEDIVSGDNLGDQTDDDDGGGDDDDDDDN